MTLAKALRIGAVFAVAWSVASEASASSEVRYGPSPAWVVAPPAATSATAGDGAPSRVVYMDTQVHLTPGADESYSAFRIKILRPEALSVGNLTATWAPASEDFTVHSVKIIRDGEVIDVLDKTKFRVIQREENLEQAMLDGNLTATLQTPGLRVGDELEFAATVTRADPLFRQKLGAGVQLPVIGQPGAYRTRVLWPKSDAVQWRVSPDLGKAQLRTQGESQELVQELRDPESATPTDGAPLRFNVRRLIQYSEFSSWSEVSRLAWPAYERAATLKPGSGLRVEAAKIAAAAQDPAARALAALKLVQDDIRYVYVGLDGGNYTPASADETWQRRFGDCKAKTVVLLALLKELGIEAEPVLVNASDAELTDILLPSPAAFDHVLVRAQITGSAYWLDGTRLGDRGLAMLPAPSARWALPVTRSGTDLQSVAAEPPLYPQENVVLEIDASGGFDKPAKIKVERTLRGQGVQEAKTTLSSLSAADAARAVKSNIQQQDGWFEPATGSWRYDEDEAALILSATGEAKLDWEGDEGSGRKMDIPAAGFTPPNKLERPKEQDQSAPWTTNFPAYKRWTTLIRLPPESAKWRWAYSAAPVDERLGGVSYFRSAELKDGVLRTLMSRRTYLPEITAAQAKEIGERLPDFNNYISIVYQAPARANAVADGAENPRLLSQTGTTLLERGELDEAIKAFDAALQAQPTLESARIGKAEALRQQGNVAAALKALDDYGPLRPDSIRLARADILAKAGRTEGALRLLDAIAQGNWEKPDMLFDVGYAASRNGFSDRVISYATRGLASSPNDAPLLRLRAAEYTKAGRLSEALADAKKAVAIQPEDPTNFRNRAVILNRLGRHEEAAADAREALRGDPADTAATALLAKTLRLGGHRAEALAVYDRWVVEDASGEALNARCWARAIENVELAKAESDCAAAVKAQPGSSNYWDSYALVALRRGDLEEALARYNKALDLNPRLAASLFGRGVTKSRGGDARGASEDIAGAKALSPGIETEFTANGVRP